MLRIISQRSEAETELGRIKARFTEPTLGPNLEKVLEILATVKRQGNQAILRYGEELDKQVCSESHLKVSGSELDAAYQQIPKELLDSIRRVQEKIATWHRLRLPKSWVHFLEPEVTLAKRYHPYPKAGLYVSTGSRACLSLLLRLAIPAQVAGVGQIILTAPPDQKGKIHPALLVAAQEVGITDIYRVGGAQAIAALAYGSETIPRVDVIAGPGDVYVTLAKKQVSDLVKVDEIQPRSELVIIADSHANPQHIALDLLAKAEQNPLAAVILLTPDLSLAEAVNQAISQYLHHHPQNVLTEKAIAHYGLAIVVSSLAEAAQLANFVKPTHLEILVEEDWELLQQIALGGTILMGKGTPKLMGDYLGNISVETFLQVSQVVEYSPFGPREIGDSLEILATEEEYQASLEALRSRRSSQI